MKDLRQKVASLRRQRGYTVAELAERTGLNPSNISLIENGKRQPQVNTLQKILDSLDADLIIKERDV